MATELSFAEKPFKAVCGVITNVAGVSPAISGLPPTVSSHNIGFSCLSAIYVYHVPLRVVKKGESWALFTFDVNQTYLEIRDEAPHEYI